MAGQSCPHVTVKPIAVISSPEGKPHLLRSCHKPSGRRTSSRPQWLPAAWERVSPYPSCHIPATSGCSRKSRDRLKQPRLEPRLLLSVAPSLGQVLCWVCFYVFSHMLYPPIYHVTITANKQTVLDLWKLAINAPTGMRRNPGANSRQFSPCQPQAGEAEGNTSWSNILREGGAAGK